MQKKNTLSLTRALLSAGVVLSVAAAAHAVMPGKFSHSTEADFSEGDAYGTVVTNLGDIKLSSETKPIDGLPDDVGDISDFATTTDGKTYIAIGSKAKILELTDQGVQVVAEFPDEYVFAIAAHGNDLLIGVSMSGESRVERMSAGQRKTLVALPDTAYIFDLIVDHDAQGKARGILLATGPKGKVQRVSFDNPDKIDTLLETQQSNVQRLVQDDQGNIFAGTDTDGLVYRIDAQGNPFVVYDAPEAVITALTVTPDGTVYAGTADADQAKPGRLEQPEKEETGRPVVEEAEKQKKAEEAEKQEEKEAVAEPGDAADQPADQPDSDKPAEDQPAPPTKEQYDALRQTLKERLEVARETGQLDAKPDAPGNNNAANNNPNDKPDRPSRAKPAEPARKKQGNAIYQIATDGFVTEVFRESATILAIVPHENKLIVATGNEGKVFSVDPALRETTVLADLDSAQVTCATPTDKGLLLGANNPGALMRMELAVAKEGGFTSQVLDAGQVSIFGTFKLTADIPKGTSVAIELRSGNVGDPEQAAWSKWSKSVVLNHDENANPLQPRELKVDVPPARYLQYRLTLSGDGEHTPVIDQADLAYVAPNTPPTVTKLQVTVPAAGEPGSEPNPKYTVQWQATDDNSDRLTYTLEYKPGKAELYLPLAKDLTANKYDWATQHVPDGWYTLRLTATDLLDNPATSAKAGGRVSEPVLIDNTAPTLEGLKAQVLGGGKVKLTAKVADELSAITSVAYSVDGSETYQASLPDDLIYDSTSEAWSVTIPDLSPGGHVIAVRAIDARGNTAYKQLIINVE